MRSIRAARVALCAAALASLGVRRPPGLADVVELRHWSYPSYTRVVVELSHAVRTQVKRLPADRAAARPPRLYLDLPRVWVGRRFEQPLSIGDGLLRGVRVGQNTLTTTRVVLDLDHFERYRLLVLQAPPRVVVDVFGHRERGPAPEKRGSTLPELPLDLRPVRTVVIDAGHGGRDPGAIGAGGIREKDVTLSLAQRLGRRLRRRGFQVVLTRRKDETLDLEERTARAEGARGDVFLSLHGNAAPRRSAHGLEIYTLDEGVERQALRVAARENGVPPARVDTLQRTLTRLRLSEASVRSQLLSKLVAREIVSGLGKRWPSTRHTVRRKGPFYVLYLSSMPSVLVEVGFLTNRQEARRLRNDRYLDALAEELADAISAYRDRISPVVAGRRP